MANLYLINKPYGENGLRLARLDKDAIVVLLQDGVYFDPRRYLSKGTRVYALRDDVERRGLAGRFVPGVECIDYPQLVDLIVANKVVNFA